MPSTAIKGESKYTKSILDEKMEKSSVGKWGAIAFGVMVAAGIYYIATHLGYRTLEVPVTWNNVLGTKVSMWLGAKGFWDPVLVRWNGLRGKYR